MFKLHAFSTINNFLMDFTDKGIEVEDWQKRVSALLCRLSVSPSRVSGSLVQ